MKHSNQYNNSATHHGTDNAPLLASFPKVKVGVADHIDNHDKTERLVTCQIDPTRSPADMHRAYEYAKVHLDFLNLGTGDDDGLLAFMIRWGPLWERTTHRRDEEWGEYPLVTIWKEQAFLAQLVHLSQAFRNANELRNALKLFVQAHEDLLSPFITPLNWTLFRRASLPAPPPPVAWLGWQRNSSRRKGPNPYRGEPLEWVRDATDLDLIEFAKRCLQAFMNPPSHHEVLVPVWGSEFETALQFSDLREAIHWMIWRDEWIKNPVISCDGCKTFFKPTNKHTRRFCSPNCRSAFSMRELRARLASKKDRKTRTRTSTQRRKKQ
ncbi:MAG: hypothetical protein HY646_18995 [Acidobacteria bacterium]|nr:hypothetical protein [Acidobacteriota bacterium]